MGGQVWLVCKKCGEKEWLQPHTSITACAKCGAPRYAEDDDGNSLILFSEGTFDPTTWGTTID